MSIKQSEKPSKNPIVYKCWFCQKEIPEPYKDKGAGICWRCGNPFEPSPYYVKPEFHKYCSKECRYSLFCDNNCKKSLKKILKKWHGMLDYTSYHYEEERRKKKKNRLNILKYITLSLLCIFYPIIVTFILTI